MPCLARRERVCLRVAIRTGPRALNNIAEVKEDDHSDCRDVVHIVADFGFSFLPSLPTYPPLLFPFARLSLFRATIGAKEPSEWL
eukprot:3464855-Rhodomonas_salina.2